MNLLIITNSVKKDRVIDSSVAVIFRSFCCFFKGQLMWIIEDERNVNKEPSWKNLRIDLYIIKNSQSAIKRPKSSKISAIMYFGNIYLES